jgi:hypothetical protein
VRPKLTINGYTRPVQTGRLTARTTDLDRPDAYSGSRGEYPFQLVKRSLLGLSPVELFVLSEQACNWDGAAAIVLDETAVAIRKAEKTLDVMNIAGCGPVDNRCYFLRVHLNSVLGDEVAQEGDLRDVEYTFF